MSWLMIYVSIAVAVLLVVTACCAHSILHDPGRLVAVVAAAVLWPVMVVGLLQFGAVRALAAYLRHRDSVPAVQLPAEAEPVTAPVDLLDTLTRLAAQVGAKHPA